MAKGTNTKKESRMRLGELQNGYIVPYPDLYQLKVEAVGYGDYKSSKYILKKVLVDRSIKKAFADQDRYVYFVDDITFIDYCKKYVKNVIVSKIDSTFNKASELPKYYVICTCNKCKKTYILNTGNMNKEQVIQKLKNTSFGAFDYDINSPISLVGECPAGGWHSEKGSMFDNMTFDFTHIYRGAGIIERQI